MANSETYSSVRLMLFDCIGSFTGFNSFDASKISIFNLIAASMRHTLLYSLPVLTCHIEKSNQLHILLNCPLLIRQVGT